MSLTFERKLPIILFFVFLMLTTIGFVFYQNTSSTQQMIAWERDAQEVTQKLDETVAFSHDIQTAINGFIYIGNETYLEPMNRAKPRISQNISRLRQLTNDTPSQSNALDQIELLLREYVQEAERKIDLRKSQGREAAMAELPWQGGTNLLNRVRALSDQIKTIEVTTLQSREQSLNGRLAWTIWILIGSSIAGIVSLGLANIVVLSEIKKRRGAENELISANEDLEKRIGRRTAELQAANEKLKEIGGEREVILLNEQSARREAEIANRLRDEFMASVSHELRTPLNSILGWARLMKGGELSDTQSKKALTTIIKNSETQNRLIEDLLDVARVISGKLELNLIEIDPAETISNSIETVRPIANAKNINIELSVEDADTHHAVSGDRNRLTQIFTNLLTNAVKFSPEGSTIQVSMSFANGTMETRIKDEGKGISPEFLPLMFERFRQDTTKASNNGGLGLGLAIVRNLVELHGGSVHAESDGENCGATFIVTLPTIQKSDESVLVPKQQFDGVQQVRSDNIG